MGIRLSSVSIGHLAGCLMVFVGFGIWSAWRWVDHSLNYTQVTAVVDTVEMRCRPTTHDAARGAELARSPVWGGEAWGDCAAAEDWARGDKQARVARSRVADIRYVSPADGQQHRGLLHLVGSDQKKIAGGSRVPIYAHDSDPLAFDPA